MQPSFPEPETSYMYMGQIRALEFFSGIGGLHLGLARSQVDANVIQAFDWDPLACRVYAANHSKNVIKKIDISTLTATTLAAFQADLWLLSPACQPFTVLNPNAKDSTDPRAKSFLHIIRDVLPSLILMNSQPSRILIENVAGFESSDARVVLLSTLRSLGYSVLELLLTPLQFGVPNSRLRYYCLAKKHPLTFAHVEERDADKVWRHIPGHEPWNDHSRMINERLEGGPFVTELRAYLDEEASLERHYAVPDNILQKWGHVFDIVTPASRRTCCFTRSYTQLVQRAGSVLQLNEEMDTASTFRAFAEAQSTAETDCLRILRPLRLRYFTPTELLKLFHFIRLDANDSFAWPEGISVKSKYRLVGNSVNVLVVTELVNYLFLN